MLWQLYGLLTSWELHKVRFHLHISICQYEELVGVRTLLHSCTQRMSGKLPAEEPLSRLVAISASCLVDHCCVQDCEALRAASQVPDLFWPPCAPKKWQCLGLSKRTCQASSMTHLEQRFLFIDFNFVHG